VKSKFDAYLKSLLPKLVDGAGFVDVNLEKRKGKREI
jgi:hypothetical protein